MKPVLFSKNLTILETCALIVHKFEIKKVNVSILNVLKINVLFYTAIIA